MIEEIKAKSILNRNRKHVDNWFCAAYSLGPYMGCSHGCIYCDGRYEKYGFDGNFVKDMKVKINAFELLKKEIKLLKEPGYVFLGSGITDAYQPIEKKYRITRKLLQIVADHPYLSVHILTKSALVERDFDILTRIAKKRKVIISYSIGLANEDDREKLEPGSSPLLKRWEIIKKAKAKGFGTGVMAMPLLPFISDDSNSLNKLFKTCKSNKVDFVLPAGMTLKSGRQKQYYLDFIKNKYPDIFAKTKNTYRNNAKWGEPIKQYNDIFQKRVEKYLKKYKLKIRVPKYLLKDAVPKYLEAALLLAHMGEYLKIQGKIRKSYKYASYSIQKWAYEKRKGKRKYDYKKIDEEFVKLVKSGEISNLNSIGASINNLLKELVTTGQIGYYKKITSYI